MYRSAAHRLHIECRTAIPDAELVLQDTGGTWEYLVRRRGRDDHQVDIVCLDAGCRNRAQTGLQGEVAGHFGICRDMPFMDTAARDDPVMRSLDDLFQIIVG
jgi:hypothetical protein